MTPYIAFSKSHDQLTCMCGDMTRHHDQIANYGVDSPTLDIPFLTGCPTSDGTLSNHSEDVVGNTGKNTLNIQKYRLLVEWLALSFTDSGNIIKFMQDDLLIIVYPSIAEEAWGLIESLQ